MCFAANSKIIVRLFASPFRKPTSLPLMLTAAALSSTQGIPSIIDALPVTAEVCEI